jgi:hypothetical protein
MTAAIFIAKANSRSHFPIHQYQEVEGHGARDDEKPPPNLNSNNHRNPYTYKLPTPPNHTIYGRRTDPTPALLPLQAELL